MVRLIFVLLGFLLLVLTTDSSARRSSITPEQKHQLYEIRRIYVNVLALTEVGEISTQDMSAVVEQRFQHAGFAIVTDRQHPHDVEFRVKCEARKHWEGTTINGGDFELLDAPYVFGMDPHASSRTDSRLMT